MTLANKKKLLVGLFLIVLTLSIPISVSLLQHKQEPRTRASGSTTLYFSPTSTSTAPIQKKVGDTVSLDMTVDPGNNLVTFIRFQVKYDSTKLQLSATDPFTLNTAVLPNKIEGPVVNSDTVSEAINVGSDPTKAIQKVSKVGTLNFKAISATTDTPTVVSFTNLTQALSAGSGDQASEDVLATTTPANITITDTGQVTPIVTGTVTPTGSPTGSPSAAPSGSPAPTPVTTTLTFTVLLHGVGNAGDNPNPGGSSLSNKNPLHPQRNLDAQIIDSNNQVVLTTTGDIIYSSNGGNFVGALDLGPNFPTGNYNVKIKSERYLRRLVPKVIHITNLQDNPVPETGIVAGDVNDDNMLNVLDYNALLDCGYGEITPLPLADPNSIFNTKECQAHTPVLNVDLDDNGVVDSPDYNLFLRELSVQNGD